MSISHKIEGITISEDKLILRVNGMEREFSLKEISPVLAEASHVSRSIFEISPSGYGIHWPLLDEDLSIDGLLGILHQPDSQRKSA